MAQASHGSHCISNKIFHNDSVNYKFLLFTSTDSVRMINNATLIVVGTVMTQASHCSHCISQLQIFTFYFY